MTFNAYARSTGKLVMPHRVAVSRGTYERTTQNVSFVLRKLGIPHSAHQLLCISDSNKIQ